MPRIGFNATAECLKDRILMTDSQDVHDVVEYVGHAALSRRGIDPAEVTGVMVKVGTAEYDEVYVTDSSRPWDRQAIYTRVA